jgi:predicted O-methyltransferase YrrM
MDTDRWTDVDRYLTATLLPDDPALEGALALADAEGLPAISVSATQGRMLQVLVESLGATAVLEVGTLAGYSSIWMARGLGPGGRLVTLELDPHHASVARRNHERAGLSGVVELRLGPAAESLAKLVAEGAGPFDLIFIDADKPSYPDYLRWSLQLSRPGTVIVADNVIRAGEVANGGTENPIVQGVRAFLEQLGAEPRIVATAIQTVGAKGYDGFALALVTG